MRTSAWIIVLVCATGWAQGRVESAPAKATAAMAQTVLRIWPNGIVTTLKKPGSWGYEEGVLLDGMAAEFRRTHNPAELAYIQSAMDLYVAADGTIRMDATGKPFGADEHQLDWIEMGRSILFLYAQTHDPRYATAAKFLHAQLDAQPRTPSGGYWHKTIYPNQMWLDGAYMAEPFRAQYALTFHQPGDFDDIARQFLLMYDHMRDLATGLLKHGWDESKKMPWADPSTGLSPQVWARAMGWYVMALADTLELFPANHPQRAKLLAAFRATMDAAVRYEGSDHLWWEVMDQPTPARGNFPEPSASAMFTYALAKGARRGYLPRADSTIAQQSWQAIQTTFIKTAPDGNVTLTGTIMGAGLGGNPYRSGTFEYYVGEKRGDNDCKGVGAYLMAGNELAAVSH